MVHVSCAEYFQGAICHFLSTKLQPRETFAADRVQATLLLPCEGSGLGLEGEDEPDPGLDEETGTLVERGLTMKDLQILVDNRVVKEAEEAFAAVHDIPEKMTDSTLHTSESTGAVPSAADIVLVFTKWHERVQLTVAAGVEMAKQRGMPLLPDNGNASLLYSRESQLDFVHWVDAKQQLEKRKSGWLNLFGREVRVLDGRFVYSMPSAHPRIDFHNLDFSLVLADVGIAMEKARKAHRSYVLAKALSDAASSVAGPNERMFMRFGNATLCLWACR